LLLAAVVVEVAAVAAVPAAVAVVAKVERVVKDMTAVRVGRWHAVAYHRCGYQLYTETLAAAAAAAMAVAAAARGQLQSWRHWMAA